MTVFLSLPVASSISTIPSREKSKLCFPSSFSMFTSCRIVIDCTVIEIAAPSLLSQQNATYSNYRCTNYFKVIVGVTPNAVVTYVSKLYPVSISDKEIVKQSGLWTTWFYLILADNELLRTFALIVSAHCACKFPCHVMRRARRVKY